MCARKSSSAVVAFSLFLCVCDDAVCEDAPATRVSTIHHEGEGAPEEAPYPVPDHLPAFGGEAPVRGPFTFVQVNVDGDGHNIPNDAGNEPSIAINPLNPSERIIGWRQFDTIANNFRQAGMAYSHDAGKSWTFPFSLEAGVFRSDPVLMADDTGTFFYSSLRGDFAVFFFLSNDAGLSWTPPIPAFGGDKQWVAIDQTGGIGHGNLYMAWNLSAGCCMNRIYSRSIDGGLTWSDPEVVPSTPIFGTLTVGTEGELYIIGISIAPLDPTVYPFSRSSNAQDPEASTEFEFNTVVDLGGALGVFGIGSPNPGGLLGQVWLDVDRSDGPNRGTLYALASVDPPGDDPLDVHLVRSSNGGETWTSPLRVNDDPISPTAWQWFGTLSIAPNGRLDVFYNDTSNDPTVTFSQLFYTFSTDGGDTWSPGRAVSRPFNHFLGYPQQNKLGDYYHGLSDDTGVSLAWAANFNGEQDVYHLRLNHLPGDDDSDGDLDLTDYSALVTCADDPNGVEGDDCSAFDFDGDDDVDLEDFGAFQRVFTGACAATIITQPDDEEACFGSVAMMSVSAAGTDLSYQWFANGVNIPGATGAELVVDPVNVLSAGSYGVTVQSTCGTEVSQSAALTLLPLPLITEQPEDLQTCVGAVAEFTVVGDAAVPPLSYQWRFNGEDIEGANDGTLTIDPVGLENVGEYRCVLTDGCDVNLISQPAILSIPAVAITLDPLGGEVCEGGSIFIFGSATGDAGFQWFKDGESIPGATTPFLSVQNVTFADAGVYNLHAIGLCNTDVSADAVIEVIDCGDGS